VVSLFYFFSKPSSLSLLSTQPLPLALVHFHINLVFLNVSFYICLVFLKITRMKRLVLEKLKSWKDSNRRKPLLVRGARQVGKSYTITQFGRNYFEGNVHVVDFEKRPDWVGIFDKNLDPVRIISELEILLNTKIAPGKDLLFFDEIQQAPNAIMSMRYFYEELPEIHLIAAGSLLEFTLKDISFPVGRIQILTMNPMNYYEFLLATGNEQASNIILQAPQELPESIHILLLENLRQYMFTGGMPESVDCWSSTQSMADVFSIQSDLLDTYKQDFSKYAPFADKKALNHTLQAVAKYIGKQIKYTRLSDDFTGPTNKKAFELLQMTRVIKKVNATSPASLPLEAFATEKRFKALLLDLGLLRALNDLPANIEYLKTDLLSLYNGAMAEQFTGQEFASAGYDNLYYWSREAKSSSAEVDYLIHRDNNIYPVEIKSGASGKLKSMHLLLKQYPQIKQGYVLSTAPYGKIVDQKLTFLPLYYAFGLAMQNRGWTSDF
jgi:hypothetical protein